MQLINGNRISRAKAKGIIRKVLGEKASFWEAYANNGVGVAGLEYNAGITEIDKIRKDLRLLANIETRDKGILIYLNNPEERYYILLPFEDVNKAEYIKEADVLKPKKGSLFSRIYGYSKNYILSKRFLLEPEIVIQNQAILTINATQEFTLKNTKNSYRKVETYLKNVPELNARVEVKDFSLM